MHHPRSWRVVVATAATAALSATVIANLPADAATAAKPAGDHARARQAATWQASQLTQGRIHNGQFDFDDWGLTIDTLFALAATGNQPRALAVTGRAVEHNYYGKYATYAGDTFAGSMAKSLLAAVVLGRNPHHFGRHDVRKLTLALVAPPSAGFESGRVRDTGATDYSNTFAQAYAVLGLARSGGVPQRAVNYLLKQQCSAGWFRLDEVAGSDCDTSASPSDVDATSLAIQALAAARKAGATVPVGVASKAGTWLASTQKKNGSFGGGQSTRASNTNSTGLAAVALRATHHPRAQREAAAWVRTLQITRQNARKPAVRKDIGAIAYDRKGLRAGLSNGIQKVERDQFRRATPQALFAFKPISLATLTA